MRFCRAAVPNCACCSMDAPPATPRGGPAGAGRARRSPAVSLPPPSPWAGQPVYCRPAAARAPPFQRRGRAGGRAVSYTHLRAHETSAHL
eukprot:1505952-Alexandrium_andersonii.AAC.1